MNRDDALKKIKKCLALAASNSPEESAIAMRQAQALMAEHKLTERDVSLSDVQEVKARSATVGGARWDVQLGHLVGDSFGCEVFTSISSRLTRSFNLVTQREVVFVGIGAAPAIAGYAYEVLARQCSKLRLAHIRLQPKNCKPITKTARGDEFARGWVAGVRRVVERFAQPEKDEQLLLSYMAAKHPDLKEVTPRDAAKGRKVASGHAHRGYQLGQQAQLDRGIGQGKPQERITC